MPFREHTKASSEWRLQVLSKIAFTSVLTLRKSPINSVYGRGCWFPRDALQEVSQIPELPVSLSEDVPWPGCVDKSMLSFLYFCPLLKLVPLWFVSRVSHSNWLLNTPCWLSIPSFVYLLQFLISSFWDTS